MEKPWFDTLDEVLNKAKEELSKAIYLSESGGNPGLRKMNANKADWLKWVVYLAERGLEYEKYLDEPTEECDEEPKTDFQKAIALFQCVKNNV